MVLRYEGYASQSPCWHRDCIFLHGHPLGGFSGRENSVKTLESNFFFYLIKLVVEHVKQYVSYQYHVGKEAPLQMYPAGLNNCEFTNMVFLGLVPFSIRGNRAAVEVAEALRSHVINRHSTGVLISDNAKEFTGGSLTKFLKHTRLRNWSQFHTISGEWANQKSQSESVILLDEPIKTALSDVQVTRNNTVNATTSEIFIFLSHGWVKKFPIESLLYHQQTVVLVISQRN